MLSSATRILTAPDGGDIGKGVDEPSVDVFNSLKIDSWSNESRIGFFIKGTSEEDVNLLPKAITFLI